MTRFCAIALAMSPMLALLGCGGGGGPSLEVKVGDEVAFSCGEMKVTELGPDGGGFRYDGCGHAVWVEFDTNSGHAASSSPMKSLSARRLCSPRWAPSCIMMPSPC